MIARQAQGPQMAADDAGIEFHLPTDVGRSHPAKGKPTDFDPAVLFEAVGHGLVPVAQVPLMGREELKVLDPVVRPVAVQMMDALVGAEPPADRLFHDVAVLEENALGAVLPDGAPNVAALCDLCPKEPGATYARQVVERRESTWIGAEPLLRVLRLVRAPASFARSFTHAGECTAHNRYKTSFGREARPLLLAYLATHA